MQEIMKKVSAVTIFCGKGCMDVKIFSRKLPGDKYAKVLIGEV